MPWRWRRWDSMSPAGPAPMMPTWVSAPTPTLPRERGWESAGETLIGIDHEVQHAQQLGLLAIVEHRHQDAVHADGLGGEPLNGTGARRRQVQPVAPAILGVADAPDEATRGKPLQYLGGGGPIQRDALTQRPLVDILLGTQRVEHGELRGGDFLGHLRVPEPFVDLLHTPNQVARMSAEIFVSG